MDDDYDNDPINDPIWSAPSSEDRGAASDQRTANSIRPSILVEPGELAAIADKAERALIDTGAEVYQRGGALVRPGFAEVDASDGRKTVNAVLHLIEAAGIRDELSRRCDWETPTKKGTRPIDPPGAVCDTILSRRGRWKFAQIVGVLTAPTLRRDGSILRSPGFDPQSGFYLALGKDFELPVIPDAPTRDDAIAALATLKELFVDFPFVAEADRAVAISLLLSSVCRAALGVVPVHCFSAPVPGSGKSFINDVVNTVLAGQAAPVIAAGGDETEMEKRLAAKLFAGTFFVSIDNLNGTLAGDLLCQLAERPRVSARVLGKSEAPEMEFRGILTANGNNLVVAGDMTRRALLGRLDPRVERPEDRQFSSDPIETILADRPKYVAAALTVMRAYLAAGMPGKLPVLASYRLWSDRVRSSMAWCGEADPAETMAAAREGDPVRAALRPVLVAWREALGDEAVTGAELAERLQNFDASGPAGGKMIALRHAIAAVAAPRGIIDAAKLGYFLRRHRGRLLDELRITGEADPHSKIMKWRLEVVA